MGVKDGPLARQGRFFSPRKHLTMSGDIFDCYKLGKGISSLYWVETRDDAKHSTVHRTDLTPTNPAPNCRGKESVMQPEVEYVQV